MKTQKFLIGYSEAWFGANFGTDYTTSFDLAYVRKVFDGVVRRMQVRRSASLTSKERIMAEQRMPQQAPLVAA